MVPRAMAPEQRLEPLTYYSREGPVGDVFARTLAGTGASRSVAAIGLGTGAISCYGRGGERWTYFEIDPVVAKIASDPRFFHVSQGLLAVRENCPGRRAADVRPSACRTV